MLASACATLTPWPASRHTCCTRTPTPDQQAQQPTKQPATNGSVKDRGGAPQGQKQKQRGQARKCINGVWTNCLRPTPRQQN